MLVIAYDIIVSQSTVIMIFYVFSVCEPAGYYASYWNVPFLPHACTDDLLKDKFIYDTLIRVNAPLNKLGKAIKELFVEVGWSSVVLLVR